MAHQRSNHGGPPVPSQPGFKRRLPPPPPAVGQSGQPQHYGPASGSGRFPPPQHFSNNNKRGRFGGRGGPMGGRGMRGGRLGLPYANNGGRGGMRPGPPPPPPTRGRGPGRGPNLIHGPGPRLHGRGVPPPPPPQQQRGVPPPPPPPPPQQRNGFMGQMPLRAPPPPPPPPPKYAPMQHTQLPQHFPPPPPPPHNHTAVQSNVVMNQFHQHSSVPPSIAQRVHPMATAQQHVASATSVAAAAAPRKDASQQQLARNDSQQHSTEAISRAWSEHEGPNGIMFYYNSILKKSTYEKPNCLQGGEVKQNKGAGEWKEYEDPATKKKYYSDGVTTTWKKPDGWKGNNSKQQSQYTSRSKDSNSVAVQFKGKDDSKKAFYDLLLSKNVLPTTKWNEVVKLFSSDKTYDACSKHLSVGERKQALAEYQTKRANELRDLERAERTQKREAFLKLLSEKVLAMPLFSADMTRFSDVRHELVNDYRYNDISTEEDRQALFLEFCDQVQKASESRRRNELRRAKEAFMDFLKTQSQNGSLTYASSYKSIDTEKDENSFAILSESDRQAYFDDYVIELQEEEDKRRSEQALTSSFARTRKRSLSSSDEDGEVQEDEDDS